MYGVAAFIAIIRFFKAEIDGRRFILACKNFENTKWTKTRKIILKSFKEIFVFMSFNSLILV